MTDIARACGVSQATVSLVLNNAPGTRISAATREAVLAKAEEINYRRVNPDRGRRPLIAMLINEASSSQHVGGLIDGVAGAAAELGLMALMLPTGEDEAVEAAAIDLLARLPVVGVIYARLITQAVKPPPSLAAWPTILLNCHTSDALFPSVVPGDLAAGITATLALLDAGHQRVGFIGGDQIVEAARERLKGYRRALAMRDVPYDPALVVKGGWTISGGRDGLHYLLDLRDPPTAVFCFCDRTAIGVYAAAAEAGLRIPEDLSIIGFDNEDFSADLDPPLTTMELPHADMARHAVEELHRPVSLPKSRPSHQRMKFDCPLVKRRSVASRRQVLEQSAAAADPRSRSQL
ncbi:LacI family DNA-binding transcriptional regulator [Rubellimicrobium rubrum]|nr:LacI family DNA-binding transcriptional regulator [Rubellimicrobium rubrum]